MGKEILEEGRQEEKQEKGYAMIFFPFDYCLPFLLEGLFCCLLNASKNKEKRKERESLEGLHEL